MKCTDLTGRQGESAGEAMAEEEDGSGPLGDVAYRGFAVCPQAQHIIVCGGSQLMYR